MLEFEEIKIDIDNDDLSIKGPMFNKVIAINSIVKLYQENITDYGMRDVGFGAIKVHTGDYHNQEFGYYKRATYTDNKWNIVVQTSDNTIYIFNQATKVDTDSIFQKLDALIK